MGTPAFAVPSLEALSRKGYEILSVVTQPDKPRGRGRALAPPPVKECALALGLPVLQPGSIRGVEFLDELTGLAPDVIIVVAYGKILPKGVLGLPKLGCVNVHSSLLPAYRGAAPVNRAIINGDSESGVTTMFMDEGMDTGPVLMKRATPIGGKETAGELLKRLSVMGAELLIETIEGVNGGTLKPVSQPESGVSYAPLLKKEDGRIDWTKTASEVDFHVRGFSPWPGAFTSVRGKSLKVHGGGVVDMETDGKEPGRPGEVFYSVTDGSINVVCGSGSVYAVTELQLEGKRRMKTEDLLRGFKIESGEKLG